MEYSSWLAFQPGEQLIDGYVMHGLRTKQFLRVKTFANHWRASYSVDAITLADAGYIYKGPGDRCVCIYCAGNVRGWKPGDDPVIIHKRYFPNCPALTGSCSWRMHGDVRGGEDIGPDDRVTAKSHLKNEFITHYSDYESRLRTFVGWKRHRKRQTPERLARSGFLYEKAGDFTFCFHCGLRLCCWEESDDEFDEHAHWSPLCEFNQRAMERE